MKLPSALISTEWLARNLEAPALRVYDATVFLHINNPGPGYTPESGREKWRAAHVPGADFIDLLGEFSDQNSPVRFTMPSPARFAELAGAIGIGDDTAVVLYSAGSVMWSTRVWWMLRSIGFDNAGILDGGWEKWQREGHPVSAEHRPYPRATLTPRPRPGLWADRDDMLKVMNNPAVCTINALSPEVYRGDKNMYGRPGHIPGSHNVFYNTMLDPANGTYLSPPELKSRFDAVGAFDRRVVVYCGGGISATMDALALTLAGHPDVAVYDGSMMEWVSDPALPLNLGAAP
ncbi:MAG: sulfurtransferase [Gammaproteobacteria bacterium]